MATHQAPSAGSSAATGGISYTVHQGLSRDSQALVLILATAGLSVALVALVMMGWWLSTERDHTKSLIESAEKRAADVAWTAKQEARIAQDKADRIEVGLGKRGININSDGH